MVDVVEPGRVGSVEVTLPRGRVELDPLAAAVLRGLIENRDEVAVVNLELLVMRTRLERGTKAANMVLKVPDAVVRSWRGDPAQRPLMALVHIPLEVLESWDRLIEVPKKNAAPARAGGLIVAP